MLTVALMAGTAWSGAYGRSMPDELSSLLLDNPQILAGESDVKAAEAGVDQATAPFLPIATLSGDKGWERVDSQDRRTSPGDPSSLARESATLSVRLNLFDGFAKNAGLTIAERQLDLAKVTLDSLRQRTLFEGAQVYLTLLRQRRLNEFAREAEAKVQQQVRLQEQLTAQAAATEVDTLLVRTRLAAAEERRLTIDAQLTELTATYLRMFGRMPELDSMTDPGLLTVDLPTTLEDRVNFALENHPDAAAAALQVDIAAQGREQARSGYMPRVDLVTEGGYERNADAKRGIRRDQKAVVELTWQLYDGGNTAAATERAAHGHVATLERRKFVLNRIAEEVRKAQNQLDLAESRVKLLETTTSLAEQVVKAKQDLLAAGRETALTVLDAEGEWISAQMNLLTAQFDRRLAYRRLLVSMGLHSAEVVLGLPSSKVAAAERIDSPGEFQSTLLP